MAASELWRIIICMKLILVSFFKALMNQTNTINKNNIILYRGILSKSSVFDKMYNIVPNESDSNFMRTLKYILKNQIFSKTTALSRYRRKIFSLKLFFLDYLKAKMINFILVSEEQNLSCSNSQLRYFFFLNYPLFSSPRPQNLLYLLSDK